MSRNVIFCTNPERSSHSIPHQKEIIPAWLTLCGKWRVTKGRKCARKKGREMEQCERKRKKLQLSENGWYSAPMEFNLLCKLYDMEDFKVNGISVFLERSKIQKIHPKIFIGKVEEIPCNSKTRMHIHSRIFFPPFRLIFATQRSSPRFLVCPIYFSLIESSRKRGSDGRTVVVSVMVEWNIIVVVWSVLHWWYSVMGIWWCWWR